ncbi:uncharacterized protein LOC123399304 [Hordeum vulgare subsp. vulgare]|uniref:uncharacterized protein LOC123399304 n=1 Tax=Hordeum vulgare subsp. vulgare TaxID=112509 RepID=UPI000B471542|nr:uncharacterized protein LOC123399304 [Hordeum vulgare subsp. vulgare]
MEVASPARAGKKTMVTAWPYVEYMAQWERKVERRQLFLRSYHFSRDAEVSTRGRTSRVVWAGARRLRRAAAKGLRRLRARICLCFGWAAPALRRRSYPRRGGVHGFPYGRIPHGKAPPAANAASVCFW